MILSIQELARNHNFDLDAARKEMSDDDIVAYLNEKETKGSAIQPAAPEATATPVLTEATAAPQVDMADLARRTRFDLEAAREGGMSDERILSYMKTLRADEPEPEVEEQEQDLTSRMLSYIKTLHGRFSADDDEPEVEKQEQDLPDDDEPEVEEQEQDLPSVDFTTPKGFATAVLDAGKNVFRLGIGLGEFIIETGGGLYTGVVSEVAPETAEKHFHVDGGDFLKAMGQFIEQSRLVWEKADEHLEFLDPETEEGVRALEKVEKVIEFAIVKPAKFLTKLVVDPEKFPHKAQALENIFGAIIPVGYKKLYNNSKAIRRRIKRRRAEFKQKQEIVEKILDQPEWDKVNKSKGDITPELREEFNKKVEEIKNEIENKVKVEEERSEINEIFEEAEKAEAVAEKPLPKKADELTEVKELEKIIKNRVKELEIQQTAKQKKESVAKEAERLTDAEKAEAFAEEPLPGEQPTTIREQKAKELEKIIEKTERSKLDAEFKRLQKKLQEGTLIPEDFAEAAKAVPTKKPKSKVEEEAPSIEEAKTGSVTELSVGDSYLPANHRAPWRIVKKLEDGVIAKRGDKYKKFSDGKKSKNVSAEEIAKIEKEGVSDVVRDEPVFSAEKGTLVDNLDIGRKERALIEKYKITKPKGKIEPPTEVSTTALGKLTDEQISNATVAELEKLSYATKVKGDGVTKKRVKEIRLIAQIEKDSRALKRGSARYDSTTGQKKPLESTKEAVFSAEEGALVSNLEVGQSYLPADYFLPDDYSHTWKVVKVLEDSVIAKKEDMYRKFSDSKVTKNASAEEIAKIKKEVPHLVRDEPVFSAEEGILVSDLEVGQSYLPADYLYTWKVVKVLEDSVIAKRGDKYRKFSDSKVTKNVSEAELLEVLLEKEGVQVDYNVDVVRNKPVGEIEPTTKPNIVNTKNLEVGDSYLPPNHVLPWKVVKVMKDSFIVVRGNKTKQFKHQKHKKLSEEQQRREDIDLAYQRRGEKRVGVKEIFSASNITNLFTKFRRDKGAIQGIAGIFGLKNFDVIRRAGTLAKRIAGGKVKKFKDGAVVGEQHLFGIYNRLEPHIQAEKTALIKRFLADRIGLKDVPLEDIAVQDLNLSKESRTELIKKTKEQRAINKEQNRTEEQRERALIRESKRELALEEEAAIDAAEASPTFDIPQKPLLKMERIITPEQTEAIGKIMESALRVAAAKRTNYLHQARKLGLLEKNKIDPSNLEDYSIADGFSDKQISEFRRLDDLKKLGKAKGLTEADITDINKVIDKTIKSELPDTLLKIQVEDFIREGLKSGELTQLDVIKGKSSIKHKAKPIELTPAELDAIPTGTEYFSIKFNEVVTLTGKFPNRWEVRTKSGRNLNISLNEALSDVGVGSDLFSQRVIKQSTFDKAVKSINDAGRRTNVNLMTVNPKLAKDLAIIGAYHIESGVKRFSKWKDVMVEELGTAISKVELKKIWKESKKMVRQVGAKMFNLVKERAVNISKAQLQSDKFIVREVENKLKKLKEREAIPFLIQGIKDPNVLKKIGRGDLIDLVNKPTKTMKEVSDKVSKYYDEAFAFLRREWGEVKFRENYVTQVWDIPKHKVRSTVSSFQTHNPFTKKRTIPTLEEGIKLGLTPKTLDIAKLLRIYDSAKINSAFNFKFAKELSELTGTDGNKLIMRRDKAPQDWITSDHPALRRAMAISKTKDGKPVLIMSDAKYHPMIATEMDLVFGEGYSLFVKGVDVIGVYEGINAIAKKGQLSLSLFHHLALTEAAFSSGIGIKAMKLWNPFKVYRAVKNKNFEIFDRMELATDAIEHRVTFSALEEVKQALIQRALETAEFKTRNVRVVGKTVKGTRIANELWDRALWDYYHNTLKLYAYEANVAQALGKARKIKMKKKGKELTEAEVEAIKNAMGDFVNDSFGGQNWQLQKVLGQKKINQMLHWAFLSPDWTISVLKQTAAPVTAVVKLAKAKNMAEVMAAKALAKRSAAFWIKAGIYFNIIAQAVNYRNTEKAFGEGKFTWQNDPGHEFNMFWKVGEDDNKEYLRWGKQFREVGEGMLDPIKKFGSKLSPLVRESIIQLTGMSPGGSFPASFADIPFWESLPKRLGHFAILPVPFSLRSHISNSPKNFMFSLPTSKGMTPYKTRKLFREALTSFIDKHETDNIDAVGVADKARRRLFRIYISALENSLDAEELFKSAETSVKSKMSLNDRSVAREIYKEVSNLSTKKEKRDLLAAYKMKGVLTIRIMNKLKDEARRQANIKRQQRQANITINKNK